MKIGSTPKVTPATLYPNNTKTPTAIKTQEEEQKTAQDKVNISGYALKLSSSKNKYISIIESLSQKKESITQQKKEFIENARKEGKDAKYINEKAAEFDKQIAQVEQELSALRIKDQNERLSTTPEAEKKAQEKLSTKPVTAEEAEQKAIASLTAISTGVEGVKASMALRTSLVDQASVIEREIAMSASGTASIGAGSQQERLEKIQASIKQLDQSMAQEIDRLLDTSKTLNQQEIADQPSEDVKDNEQQEPLHNQA